MLISVYLFLVVFGYGAYVSDINGKVKCILCICGVLPRSVHDAYPYVCTRDARGFP